MQVLDIPLLEISEVETARNKQAIKNVILNLDNYDFLIFVSQNAVKHAFEWIEDFWPQLPEQQILFAIGAKTAATVRELCDKRYSLTAEQLITAKGSMNSEALLAHDCLQNVQGKKILIFKGLKGRKELAQTLTSRGAQIEYCELYERSFPKEALESFTKARLDKDVDIFAVFSGESLANLARAIELNEYAAKKEIPLVVPGPRVEELARSLNFQTVLVAENASEESMWQTINNVV